MAQSTVENLNEAHHLYRQALQAQLAYGCLEVALQALGGSGHIIDLLEKPNKKPEHLFDVIERQGFAINWIATVDNTITPEQFEYLLEDKYVTYQGYPHGKLAGYLCLEEYPQDPTKPGHAIAILPRHHLSRNDRKILKKTRSYVVVDTGTGGIRQVTTEQLVKYAEYVAKNNGDWGIAQIKHVSR